jgi:DNA gyrase subunit A
VNEHSSKSADIESIDIAKEMETSYIDYAMSTIVARAIPDVRDGLKPVQRRLLYAMDELGGGPTAAYRKSARVVGDTMGKYHPHGDQSLYDALVRMAQDFSMRYCLVDGQGNFGSVDGDPAAAMRYTETRLTKVSAAMLDDIDRDTVDFVGNFDGSSEMPEVLPSVIPNLLLNGATGIAVGMATNMPPHNLREIGRAIEQYIDDPEVSSRDLMRHVRGPDFPTAGIILGTDGIEQAYTQGRGRMTVQAKVQTEEVRGNTEALVVSELPYMVNKANLVERIATLVRDKVIEGIRDIRDESDRHGMRVVIELRNDARDVVVLNRLFKHTSLQTTFSINNLALVPDEAADAGQLAVGQPEQLSLRRLIELFVRHRQVVVRRRAQFDLRKAEAREHLLEGYAIALEKMDDVIKVIRAAEDTESARNELMQRFGLTQIQANAILDMQLRRLVRLERNQVREELGSVRANIKEFVTTLADEARILEIIRTETRDVVERFGDERKTQIRRGATGEFNEEDLVADEDCLVTMSSAGYVKRVPANTYRRQGRGGKGIRGFRSKTGGIVEHFLVANTHDHLLFFTNMGKVYRIRAYELPEQGRDAQGHNLINLLPIEQGERVTAALAIPNFETGDYLVFGTRRGEVKRSALTQFVAVRSNGLLAMDINDDDELAWVRLVTDETHVMFFTRDGMSIRFKLDEIRASGRTSGGVRAIRLGSNDDVVAMDLTPDEGFVLLITESGYGKKMDVNEFRPQGRGGQGLKAIKLSAKTAKVADARTLLNQDEEIAIVTSDGQVMRCGCAAIRPLKRAAAGVIVMRMDDGETLLRVARLADGRDGDVGKAAVVESGAEA